MRPGVLDDLHSKQFETYIHSLSCLNKYTEHWNRFLVSLAVYNRLQRDHRTL